MTLLRALADVDVPGAESERPRHRLLLVLEGRAGQMEMPLVQVGLVLLGWKKSKTEPGVITGQERDAVVGVVGYLAAEHAAPEARQTKRIVRIETNCQELTRHPAPHLRSEHSKRRTGHVLRAQTERYGHSAWHANGISSKAMRAMLAHERRSRLWRRRENSFMDSKLGRSPSLLILATALKHRCENVHEPLRPARVPSIFTGPTGAPGRGNFNKLVKWTEAVTKIGASGLHLHDLRYPGNTLAARSGVSTRDLMARMGQDSMNAALIYQHATSEADRAIAASLDAQLVDDQDQDDDPDDGATGALVPTG